MAQFIYRATTNYPINDDTFYYQPLKVFGTAGTVTNLSITLVNLQHDFADDLDFMLASPTGSTLVFLSDSGGGGDLNGNYTFTDNASTMFSDGTTLNYNSGSYLPSDYGEFESAADFFAPFTPTHAAPIGAATFASQFNGVSANGVWTLYWTDDDPVATGYLGGFDITVQTNSSAAVVDGTEGADSFSIISSSANAGTFNLNGQAVEFSGVSGTFFVNAGAGNDTIIGGDGKEWIDGGAGDDLINGGAGIDTVTYATATGGVSVSLSLLGVQNTESAGLDTLSNIENLIGSSFADDLRGNANGNRIDGNDGNDLIVAGAGNDTLDGGAGRDVVFGDDGNDRIDGGSSDDRLYGDAGDDRIVGGTGADLMVGGAGDDIYFVDDAGDMVAEYAGGGIDRVVAGMSYTLGIEVEVLRLREGAYDGTGNSLDNTIRGVGGANTLRGLSGNDDLFGGTGNDVLYGGNGNDRLYGEQGQDTMTGGAGSDFYIFQNAGEMGDRVAVADVIADFSQADGDRINLRNVDANTGAGGDQNFAFIGTAAFTGTAGQLRYFQTSTSTVVEMDVDGDGTGDLYIRLDGHIDLAAGDFVL